MAKELFEIDYLIKASPRILYEFLKLPSLLSQWFCDKCDNFSDEYTFIWKGYSEKAILIDDIEEELIAYHWENSTDEEYFEFAIEVNEISGDTVLIINDFAEPNEIKDQIMWWDEQIEKLQRAIGG
ncbi:MAG: START-like domain-containing protein [Chitinophagales bacterium]|jgi:uncharacterized protein YndB with AHSA1/START domain|nr:START-like domain-containing protein [Chitinophagales bacterium]